MRNFLGKTNISQQRFTQMPYFNVLLLMGTKTQNCHVIPEGVSYLSLSLSVSLSLSLSVSPAARASHFSCCRPGCLSCPFQLLSRQSTDACPDLAAETMKTVSNATCPRNNAMTRALRRILVASPHSCGQIRTDDNGNKKLRVTTSIITNCKG